MNMNDKKSQADHLPTDDDQIYDLLVDGELDNDRRRNLLGSLDDKPGGWRCCALAFLEAQSWGQEFRSLSDRLSTKTSSTSKSVPAKKKSSRSKSRRKNSRTSMVLGMAASFLLAMGITSLMRDMNPNGMMPEGTDVSGVMPQDWSKGLKNFGKSTRSKVGPLGLEDDARELRLVKLTGRALDGKNHTFGLPAVSQKNLNDQWIKEMPTAIPDGVVEAFQRAGHKVKTSRQLLPFQTRDGRKLIIPVDQVDIRYATTPYYQ